MSDRKSRQKPIKSPPKDRLRDLPVKVVIWVGLGIPMLLLTGIGVVVLWIREKTHAQQQSSPKRREKAGKE